MIGKLSLGFESGRVEVGIGSDGRWWFSFYTDTEGSYLSADISEDTLRAFLAFIDTPRGGIGTEARKPESGV